MDLTASKKEVMFNLPSEKKWQLYLSKKMVIYAFYIFQIYILKCIGISQFSSQILQENGCMFLQLGNYLFFFSLCQDVLVIFHVVSANFHIGFICFKGQTKLQSTCFQPLSFKQVLVWCIQYCNI